MDRGTQAVVVVTVVTALAGLFILLRVISRFVIVRAPGPEDYCIILALVLAIGLAVIVDLQRRSGLGKHAVDVSGEDNIRLLQLLYSSILVYNSGLAIVKASLLYQYLRFFVERRWRRACHIMFVIVVLGALSFLLTSACTCIPVAAFWNTEIEGRCINTQSESARQRSFSTNSVSLLVCIFRLQSGYRFGLLGFATARACKAPAAQETEGLSDLRLHLGGFVSLPAEQ